MLYRYECVIVPDFGGFVMNTKSAIISPYSKTFYPPHKLITFNGHLKNNDGLLANYIASVDKVPFDSAMNFIKFEVNEWKEEIIKSDLLAITPIKRISIILKFKIFLIDIFTLFISLS